MSKKYIINTGCSYGVMFRSMKKFTNGNDSDFELIDLHCDSFGAEYQKRSVIYTVSKLLSEGISPKDILVIIEWSQPNRLFTEIPGEFCEHIFQSSMEGAFVLDSHFKLKELSSKYVRKYKINVVFGDKVYTNPDVDDLTYFGHKGIVNYLTEYKNNCNVTHKAIDRYEHYLQSIVDTQSFFKSKNIEHISFLMNDTFTDIEKESDYLNELWNQVDFSKFVFHKQYGGIDEFAMDEFGNIAYVKGAEAEGWGIPPDGNCMHFGAHPHDSIYIDFFEKHIYPKTKEYFGELVFDYSDRWSRTKQNAIRKDDN